MIVQDNSIRDAYDAAAHFEKNVWKYWRDRPFGEHLICISGGKIYKTPNISLWTSNKNWLKRFITYSHTLADLFQDIVKFPETIVYDQRIWKLPYILEQDIIQLKWPINRSLILELGLLEELQIILELSKLHYEKKWQYPDFCGSEFISNPLSLHNLLVDQNWSLTIVDTCAMLDSKSPFCAYKLMSKLTIPIHKFLANSIVNSARMENRENSLII